MHRFAIGWRAAEATAHVPDLRVLSFASSSNLIANGLREASTCFMDGRLVFLARFPLAVHHQSRMSSAYAKSRTTTTTRKIKK
jgi:hypothetical protein